MALPTTNLTAHFNASDSDNLWAFFQAGAPYHNTVPGDGVAVEVVDDDEGKGISLLWNGAAANSPNWRSSTPLMALPCLDFNGSNDVYNIFNHAGDGHKLFTQIFSVSAKTVLISFYVEGVTTSSANAYSNEALISDQGGYFGIHLRNNAGVYSLQCYNWDTGQDKVEFTIQLNTSYVVMYRHDGSNLYASLNGSAESSVASGNTNAGAATYLDIGRGASATAYANVRIGEIACYDANLTGASLTDAIAYFNRWLPSATLPGKSVMVGQAVNQASYY